MVPVSKMNRLISAARGYEPADVHAIANVTGLGLVDVNEFKLIQ